MSTFCRFRGCICRHYRRHVNRFIVGLGIEFVGLGIEFVGLGIEFVGLGIEFVGLGIEFVGFRFCKLLIFKGKCRFGAIT